MTSFDNVYGDKQRAASYARLEFPGTYYLAYRDIPAIIDRYGKGEKALDFGCGTGRSTRFLAKLGLKATGVDIAPEMVQQARQIDSTGDYHVIADADFSNFPAGSFDLVLSAFTFDNIPTLASKRDNLVGLRRLLKPGGMMINLVSSPDIYLHEWASFSTRDFPDNRNAKSGDTVRIVMKDVDDQRPVEDVLFTDRSYRELYQEVGLSVVDTIRPLAEDSEPYDWITETRIAPWVIYVLGRD